MCIRDRAIALKSGARGLRSVMEQALIGIMYEIPSDPGIMKVTVTADTILGGKPKVERGVPRIRYSEKDVYKRQMQTRWACLWAG